MRGKIEVFGLIFIFTSLYPLIVTGCGMLLGARNRDCAS